jgi:hypothetical protein
MANALTTAMSRATSLCTSTLVGAIVEVNVIVTASVIVASQGVDLYGSGEFNCVEPFLP